jgi:hypothetical protein
MRFWPLADIVFVEFAMRMFTAMLVMVLSLLGLSRTAEARVNISIDLSSQRMHVTSNSGSYSYAISSGRRGFATPRGSYRPTSLQKMHLSRKYHNSPMPHSIFFRGGYAIHGTGAVGALGRPASHGCIRLAPGNAAQLFKMVKAEGASIQITGNPPGSSMYAKAKTSHKYAKASSSKHRSYAAAHKRSHSNALAYAPSPRKRAQVKYWQMNPVGRY